MVNKVRHFYIYIISRVLIDVMCRAQVFHVEMYRRARIPNLKRKSKYSILNIDPVCTICHTEVQ